MRGLDAAAKIEEGTAARLPLSRSQFRRVARRKKNEVLLHLLPKAERTKHQRRHLVSQGITELDRALHGNFVGIGFGTKESGGAFTGELAVRMYVKRKIPSARLTCRTRIPPLINGIITDVIAVGTLRFHARPILAGASISHERGSSGSLACVVMRTGDDSRYLLSACHVFAPAGIAQLGDTIVEPAAPNPEAARIGSLADFEPLRSDDDDSANEMDAAIARLDNKDDVLNRIPVIGPVRTQTMELTLYQSVRKFGAVTLHTLGVVTDPFADVSFMMAGVPYRFNDVIEIVGCGGHFSEGGDSGALVVDALTGKAVGLIIGGNGVRTYVSPIEKVLNRFNARLVQ